MGEHIVDGEFQSDKYPTTPRGKVPLSVKDPAAQDLLWEYAQRRRKIDESFADDLEATLVAAGYPPPPLSVRAARAATVRQIVTRFAGDRIDAPVIEAIAELAAESSDLGAATPDIHAVVSCCVAMAVDAALAEMARQAGNAHRQFALESRGAGIAAVSRAHIDAMLGRPINNARREPEAPSRPLVVGDIVERVKPSDLAPGPRGIIVRLQTAQLQLRVGELPYVVRWPDGTETGYRASEIRHAVITTELCYQDPAHSSAWCAVHHEVPDWHSDVAGYDGPAGWVCASGGLFDAAKGSAARAEHDAKFAADPPADTAPPSQRVGDPGDCTPYAHHWVAGSRACQCGEAQRDGDCRFWRTESRLTDEEFRAAPGGSR